MNNAVWFARKSSQPLKPFRSPGFPMTPPLYAPRRPFAGSLLASVLLIAPLAMMSSGCGTPVIKVDTSTCNRAEWTKRAPEALPLLDTKDTKAATKNHNAVTNEFFDLKDRHDALSECVEVNSRG